MRPGSCGILWDVSYRSVCLGAVGSVQSGLLLLCVRLCVRVYARRSAAGRAGVTPRPPSLFFSLIDGWHVWWTAQRGRAVWFLLFRVRTIIWPARHTGSSVRTLGGRGSKRVATCRVWSRRSWSRTRRSCIDSGAGSGARQGPWTRPRRWQRGSARNEYGGWRASVCRGWR